MNIAYIGYSDILLDILMSSNDYEVKKIIYVESRVSERYRTILRDNKIENLKIAVKEDIPKIKKFLGDIDIVLMYKFEFILPQELIDAHRIFNFHGGSLRTNRGPHAVVRSIINRDKETALSLYELIGGIDVGLLIGEYIVSIGPQETVKSLSVKLQEGIPILLYLLKDYLQGNIEAVLIDNGKYYSKITKADYTIDLYNDSFEKMDAVLRSQKDYSGAICYLDNKEIRIRKWLLEKTADNNSRDISIEDKRIVVTDVGMKLTLYITGE